MGDPVGPCLLMIGDGVRRVPMPEIATLLAPELAALALRLDRAEARLALLEARPEEVAHFTALAALPTVAAAATFTLRLAGLVPVHSGDILLAGQIVEVRPASPLPSGIEMGVPLATADGVVSLPMKATVAVKTSAPLVWSITALR